MKFTAVSNTSKQTIGIYTTCLIYMECEDVRLILGHQFGIYLPHFLPVEYKNSAAFFLNPAMSFPFW